MTDLSHVFPFGRPVRPCPPSASKPKKVFVLGAYPSALHVSWTPPAGSGLKRIQAIAVDNEPEPFWNGRDQAARVDAWKSSVGFRPEWGTVSLAGKLNGSSGEWVDQNVFGALGVARADCWVTDCLDTYRCSEGLSQRLENTYALAVEKLGLPSADLEVHPSEAQIVEEAVRLHRDRLMGELAACRPDIVVTLGNAALRVARELVEGLELRALVADAASYGRVHVAGAQGRPLKVLPLAHPAAPAPYQALHTAWAANARSELVSR